MLARLQLSFIVAFCALHVGTVSAQSLRFYASPYRVYEGDAVRFIYVDERDGSTVSRGSIRSWKWDFDGDGTVDAAGEIADGIDATWFATFDPAKATNGVQYVSPSLSVTYQTAGGGMAMLSVTNITEDTFGIDGLPDPHLIVLARSLGNSDIQINISANPRLTTSGGLVRFYADVRLLRPGRVENSGIVWFFGDSMSATGSNPSHVFTDSRAYDVALRVGYSITGPPARTNEITRTNVDYIRVVTNRAELTLGRAYRRGFPEEYGWDDIIKAYSAVGYDDLNHADSYVYYHHFETAYNELLNELGPRGQRMPDSSQRQAIAEIVNEVLQGQNLVGNQRLTEALRSKYPRLADFDPDNPPERLPVPPGVRDETLAIDVALLDFQTSLAYPFFAIQEFGLGILRTRAPLGNEPFPDFPGYLTFLDPTLSQQPIPIKNEYWQLTTALDHLALGTVEKAKRLFRLSVQDPTARAEAKEECKKAGMQGYLGMAVLAAGQEPSDFAANEGNSLLAHVKNARDLFEAINAGLNPLYNDGSFIPNESFSATYQDALEAVTDAREAEIHARQEDRTFDQFQADLRNEQQNQRGSFITPLRNLTGIDPVLYNNLQTVDDQIDYRNTVRSRVNALVASYPNANPAGLGEYGAQVISVIDAGQAIEQAINRLNNLYESIKIAEWANTEVDLVNDTATKTLAAHDIARGYAAAFSRSFTAGISITAGVTTLSTSSSITFNPGSLIDGYLNAEDRDIQRIQSAHIADIQLEADIRKSLLEIANLAIDIRRSKNRLDQERLRLDQMLSQMDRLIEDLAHARETAANLYFQDPSFRVVVSEAQRRADAELDFTIDRLFRLAKTLEYEWTEPYQNPLVIPVFSQESPSLENPLFDKFSKLDSLFVTRTADEAKDYLDALKAWDSKLRRISVTGVRGPNHAGPIAAEPISVREQLLGFRVGGTNTLERSIQQFRDYLEQHRQTNFFNPLNPLFEFEFSTGIADNSFFPATGSRWNMRIATITIDLLAESGFSTKQVAEIDLTESGMTTLRRFFAEPPFADDLFNLTFNVGRPDRTVFGIVVPAKINGAAGGRFPQEFIVTGLANRPIAATRWVLRIDTSNPSNRELNFAKLKDIIIRFTYTYGNPPEFANF